MSRHPDATSSSAQRRDDLPFVLGTVPTWVTVLQLLAAGLVGGLLRAPVGLVARRGPPRQRRLVARLVGRHVARAARRRPVRADHPGHGPGRPRVRARTARRGLPASSPSRPRARSPAVPGSGTGCGPRSPCSSRARRSGGCRWTSTSSSPPHSRRPWSSAPTAVVVSYVVVAIGRTKLSVLRYAPGGHRRGVARAAHRGRPAPRQHARRHVRGPVGDPARRSASRRSRWSGCVTRRTSPARST